MDELDILLEAELTAAKRNELSDSEFGVPELRKFPLNDKVHVIKAKQFFDDCPDKYKAELRSRINNAAKKFGVEPMEESIYMDDELDILLEAVYTEALLGKKKEKKPSLVEKGKNLYKEDAEREVIKPLLKARNSHHEVTRAKLIITRLQNKTFVFQLYGLTPEYRKGYSHLGDKTAPLLMTKRSQIPGIEKYVRQSGLGKYI